MRPWIFCAFAAAVAAGALTASTACSSSSSSPTSSGGEAGAGDGAGADAANGSDATAADAGGDTATASGPMACYVASQSTCDEYLDPTPQQAADVPVACANKSGVFSQPPACPTTGFVGKCTIGSGKGAYATRFYAPSDASAMQSFCTGTAMGTWSTTF